MRRPCRSRLAPRADRRPVGRQGPCSPGRRSGFTLLEVLIALTVLALTMATVIRAAGSYTNNQAYLRDRTLAVWTARNVLAEQQLENAWPGVGEFKGTTEMGKREWRWLATVTQTEEKELRRLDIEVSPLDAEDDERPLAVLSGFLQQPLNVIQQ